MKDKGTSRETLEEVGTTRIKAATKERETAMKAVKPRIGKECLRRKKTNLLFKIKESILIIRRTTVRQRGQRRTTVTMKKKASKRRVVKPKKYFRGNCECTSNHTQGEHAESACIDKTRVYSSVGVSDVSLYGCASRTTGGTADSSAQLQVQHWQFSSA